jgi:hypothetical protein
MAMLYNKTSTLAPDTGRWELFIVLSHQETMLYHLNTILNSRKYVLHYVFGARKRTRVIKYQNIIQLLTSDEINIRIY